MQPRSRFLQLSRGLHHLRHWGDESAPLVLLLHGWLDLSATFQLLVEAMPARWHFVAPDWRGYGLSEWHHRPYWLGEFVADLDELVKHLSPNAPVTLVGHSMGGNLATLWGAARPARLDRLALIESFGHPPFSHAALRGIQQRWLQEAQGAKPFTVYPDTQAFARRLQRDNPRLSTHNAQRIADWSTRTVPGGVAFNADPWHRSVFNHVVISPDHFAAAYAAIKASTLWVTGTESEAMQQVATAFGGQKVLDDRFKALDQLQSFRLSDAGHNLHHEHPEQLAKCLTAFLER